MGYDGQLFGTQHVVEYQKAARSHQALLFRKLDESVVEEDGRLAG